MVEISNGQLTVQIAEMGAELQSIKDGDGREYLWQAGEKWPRRAPILFPIVCSVNDDTYTVDGQQYHLPRHGFARDMEFTLIAQGEEKAVFALHETEETLKVYPYRFNLAVSYKLTGQTLHVVWHVENTNKFEMHFQIGGHPAFLVPGAKEDRPLRGVLRVDSVEPLMGLKSYIDGSHEMTEIPVASQDGLIAFDDEFFAADSVKLHRNQTSCVELLDSDGEAAVTVDYRSPVIAFWSPYRKQAPFVCIEPWYGLGDPRGFSGEFRDKPLMNHLQPGASFMSEYTITIREQ